MRKRLTQAQMQVYFEDAMKWRGLEQIPMNICEIIGKMAKRNPREAGAVQMYYGLCGEEPVLLHEIGKKYNVGPERAKQLRHKGLRILHHQCRLDAHPLKSDPHVRGRSVYDLDLSVRAFNVLRGNNIIMIGELADYPKHKLLREFGVGPKTLKEIDDALKELGLTMPE